MAITPYADVNVVLSDFLMNIQSILGEHFRGMYLSGSLALGDFAPHRSDIDFIVATDIAVMEERLAALRAMHERFNSSASPWATEVEAAYIPLDALRRYEPTRALHPHIERGQGRQLAMDQLDGWMIQYYILREYGIAVAGPPARELIDPISASDLRRATVSLMDQWWGTMLRDATPLHYTGYQAYAVLTMCRVLYTLATGSVTSKPVAARWALATLDASLQALIEQALLWRKDPTWGEEGHATPPDTVIATQALIRLALARCQEWKRPLRTADQ